jgi:hypothetical protein
MLTWCLATVIGLSKEESDLCESEAVDSLISLCFEKVVTLWSDGERNLQCSQGSS